MSSFSPTPSSSSQPFPSQFAGDQQDRPGSFYRNLFYILIGILCGFSIFSFITLMRARRRRRAIINEALRLGVMVPGVPGYLTLQDREALLWMKSDGNQSPDWWEIEKLKDPHHPPPLTEDGHSSVPMDQQNSVAQPTGDLHQWQENQEYSSSSHNFDSLQPLATIPPVATEASTQPMPISNLKYFPNHLAYRPAAFMPPPGRFMDLNSENMTEKLGQLKGNAVEVVVVIRMPVPSSTRTSTDDEDVEVFKEWGGIELGVTKLQVAGEPHEAH
ncbi:hypothetical protein I312_101850 [Cryptococcus bacillisporus CA1280]|uniref:Uncharacterized protein n=1 Tax=Cryptococcus bacillisporus CA1280 TaxID=1296109 RepID=A0A0D0UJ13_CRYGA|nr:hypothetical protein I312_02655 [Cryptococcus bacillisporus CA1280]